ncbi:hypothetical protein GCM10023188_48520 [Pontibacter saemangeumensis]|uniref:Uncharacterized protein n=1 Tax=Pontibacter saemangeumensis TaxID=1084525 RepID=A0ABP8M6J0_9BACT
MRTLFSYLKWLKTNSQGFGCAPCKFDRAKRKSMSATKISLKQYAADIKADKNIDYFILYVIN